MLLMDSQVFVFVTWKGMAALCFFAQDVLAENQLKAGQVKRCMLGCRAAFSSCSTSKCHTF